MLSVEEAGRRILGTFSVLPAEPAPLLDALGLTLAEDICATFDIPPLSNSAMDGYAVRAEDTLQATPDSPRRLRILSNLPAGYVSDRTVEPGTAIRIMTGAPVPEGADAVVQVELTDRQGDDVLVQAEVARWRNVRHAGEDVRAGETVLARGARIRPAEVGVLASLGLERVPVVRRPKVGILATGDELLELGEPLAAGKIYNSNAYSTAAQVLEAGGVPVRLGVARDTQDSLRGKLGAALQAGVDMLISSGGVSVGDFDLVKDMLAAEGEVDFWQVNMKPGKPLAFGRLAGVPMLGLPGNPVSSMVSFELFGRPALHKMLGQPLSPRPQVTARLLDRYHKTDGRRHFLRVRVEERDGEHVARLTGEQGSGILTSLSRANGLAVVPESSAGLRPGDQVTVSMLDWL
ncbi:MAG: molybdopterin molybdotransferase MoeA [Chloroflexota bacterium]|nr:molybdopterin molybdotransferase MoeA [Chloroflexota bacterium]